MFTDMISAKLTNRLNWIASGNVYTLEEWNRSSRDIEKECLALLMQNLQLGKVSCYMEVRLA